MVQTGYVPVGSAALVRRLQNPTWGSVVRSVISTSGVMGVWKVRRGGRGKGERVVWTRMGRNGYFKLFTYANNSITIIITQ